jgi:hypothetical protein
MVRNERTKAGEERELLGGCEERRSGGAPPRFAATLRPPPTVEAA